MTAKKMSDESCHYTSVVDCERRLTKKAVRNDSKLAVEIAVVFRSDTEIAVWIAVIVRIDTDLAVGRPWCH